MLRARKTQTALFVDRTTRQWVVLDQDGNYWILPNVERPWDQRRLIHLTEETELEPIPGHYKHMLGLPSTAC